MRILFLSHYFPPESNAPANRTHEHARRWAKDGHEVTVVTGVPNHPKGVLYPGYENRWRQEEFVDGVRVVRTWMYLTPNEGFLRRTLNYVLFAATAVLAGLRAERPDVVIATSPQFFCGLAGAVVAKLRRLPFVLEIRDLWPDSIVQLGQLRNRRAIAFLEAVESRLYRSAAGIVVNTRAFTDHIANRGIPRDRIELVYNGIDPELFRPRPPDADLLVEHDLENRFVVAYIGTLGLAHGLLTLLETARRFRDEPDVTFVFVGDGADRERLEAEAKHSGLENVRFVGLRPRAEVPAWIASCDAMLVLLRDLPVFQTVIPSKLFEFLAQERPVILAAPPGESRALLEEGGAGIGIAAEDANALEAAIRQVRDDPTTARDRARAGREWVDRHFVRDDLARRMAAFVERVAEASAG
ncbi:MAG: glycosyltransferase family 4 protein [Proteobacteria bacterium]|nr:glycosyltransferase family 4 protein [Pseudomonadota bacterium]